MINNKENYLCRIEILETFYLCVKMISDSFKNFVNKMRLQIISNIYVLTGLGIK